MSGVILAGGASRRMGNNKALLPLGGRPMIAIVAERLRAVVDEVIIAADDVQTYAPYADRCVPDRYAGVGTLAGIHAGLAAARNDLALVVGCDMPFLDPRVLEWFVQAAAGYDVVVLRQGDMVEPLHAAYRRTVLPEIEAAIGAGRRRVISFFPAVRVRSVLPAELVGLDPALRSFQNVNTPDEWRAISAGSRGGPTA